MRAKKLYLLLTTALLLGYSWLFLFSTTIQKSGYTLCFFKNCTGYACPSCGTTRSVYAIFKGKVTKGILINPIGLIVAILMVILPLWLTYDTALKKESFFTSYKKAEKIIAKKHFAIILVALVAVNWIWNIYKGL